MPTLTVKIDDELNEALEALRNGGKTSDILRDALNLWIKQKRQSTPKIVAFPDFQIKDALDMQPPGLPPRSVRMKVTYTTLFGRLDKQWVKGLLSGTQVQVLMLDEKSPYVARRNQDLELPEGKTLERIREAHADIKGILQEVEKAKQLTNAPIGSIEVRTYDRIPYFPFYIVDDVAYTGYYVTQKSGYQTDYIRIAGLDSPYVTEVVTEFNRVWASAKKLTL